MSILRFKLFFHSFPASYMEDLQPLFEIDPLLLRFFVYRTPLNNLYSLFGKVPTSIMLMRLAQEFDDFQKVRFK